ncbi:hypothetical protein Calle1_60 [Cellulophaga phage Calle_1]|uniref:Uncharacterized protein n=1 Tax=Cellulophaga phage Calle_1 TaxID=2745643 RepID=A0A8E5E812_9CAUD|nr:hypothetical protein M1M22_gp055 [Cellulophaga phage Calle_1]QQV89755.1 hypothetical protein Calle1_60 [Cellulophaga phage Calle_1]QQV89834.1 hypothetical protein Calle2_60 [Cellulophaga phage Calle_2]QQV89885.1 hypothetical protein Calle3_60 [Cellulophaga phage Calle_3]
MEDNLDSELAKLVKKGIEVAESTGDFVIEQAPILLQEFYRWHIASESLGIAFSFLYLFIAYKIFILLGRKEKSSRYNSLIVGRYYEKEGPMFTLLCIFTTIVATTSLYSLVDGLYNLLKVIIAPRLYLIEYFINQ